MIAASLIYNLGQTVLDSSKITSKKSSKTQKNTSDPQENQIIEDYEGECEKCQNTKPQKSCSICGA